MVLLLNEKPLFNELLLPKVMQLHETSSSNTKTLKSALFVNSNAWVLPLKTHKLIFNDMVLNCWMLPHSSNKLVLLVLLKTSHLLLELLLLLAVHSEALVFLSVELNSAVLSVEILVVHQAHSQAASKVHQLVELVVSVPV